MLLAIITVMNYPVQIGIAPGTRNGAAVEQFAQDGSGRVVGVRIAYDPGQFIMDGAQCVSFISLGHELFHVLDIYAFFNGDKNYYWHFNPNHSLYNEPFPGQPVPRAYIEARAWVFENSLRAFFKMEKRLTYSGVLGWDINQKIQGF